MAVPQQPQSFEVAGSVAVGEFDYQVSLVSVGNLSSDTFDLTEGTNITITFKITNLSGSVGVIDSFDMLSTGEGFSIPNPLNNSSVDVVPLSSNHSGVTSSFSESILAIDTPEDNPDGHQFTLTLTASSSEPEEIVRTAIKLNTPNGNSQFCVFSLRFIESVSATVTPPYNRTSDGLTTRFDITYVGESQGSRPAIDVDLTMVNDANPTGNVGNYSAFSSIVFQDRDNNTITSIPYYGTTEFKVLVTCIADLNGFYYNLDYRIRFYNASNNIDKKSEVFGIETVFSELGHDAYIGSEVGDTKAFMYDLIAGSDSVQASVPVRMWFGEVTYDLQIENISAFPNIQIESIPSVSLTNSSPSQTSVFTITATSGQQSLEEQSFVLKLVDQFGNVIDQGELVLTVVGAIINFTLTHNKFEVPQNGSITLDANVSLEDNGVVINEPLQLTSSNMPSYIEPSIQSITPAVRNELYPITLSITDGAEALVDHPITLTLQIGEIQASASFKLTIFFSSVSDFESNPIIENEGIVRVLGGANSVIKGKTAQGTWVGFIDRDYMNGLFKPEPDFHILPTTISPFGDNEEEFVVDTTNNGIAGNFGDETVYYKVAQIYDGNQRSLLSAPYEADYNGDETADPKVYKYGSFNIKIPVTNFNPRLTELEIYRCDTQNGAYDRILNIPLVDDTSSATTGSNNKSTSTTFTGTVKTNKTMYTDLPANSSWESHNPDNGILTDAFFNSSHWRIFLDEAQVGSFQNTFHWDYYQKLKTDANGVLSVEYLSTDNFRSGNNLIPSGTNGSLFKVPVKIKNFIRHKPNPISAFIMGKHSYSVDDISCTMFRGRDLIFCTTDTGTEDALVGKYLKYGNQIRQITANFGKFIQVDSKWDGSADITGATFTLLNSESQVTYTKVTESSVNKYNIAFNDMKFSSIGTTPIEAEVSIDVNGRHATVLNGRLFQGNLVLDPDGVAEVRPFWVSYSELDQLDVNPVSNILTFLDKEGGAVTGLSSLYGRLVVMKEYSTFLVNCPSNISPANWSVDESIHDIGSIAPNGYIEQGDQLYMVFHDGIYRLIANNLASADSTPTEKLKITDPIQNIYDEVINKHDIHSIYDQSRNEILFRWHRKPKNLLPNSDFASGTSYWTVASESGGSINDEQYYEGSFSGKVEAKGLVKNLGTGIISDFVEIDDSKVYNISFFAKVPELSNESFKVNVLFYDQNKSHIGGYPSIVSFNSVNDTWTQYHKTFSTTPTTGYLTMPTGARYVRLRAYWWTSSQTQFPQGIGYIDKCMIEEATAPTSWETYESKQEIWGYNVITGQWRQVHTSGSVGKFAYDKDNTVIYWDNRDHLVKSFNKKESVSASLTTNPISLTGDRSEIVRQINTKVKSDDALVVNVIPDENIANQVSRTLATQTSPTLESRRMKSRCKKVQIEIVAPESSNDVEIHNIELEYT